MLRIERRGTRSEEEDVAADVFAHRVAATTIPQQDAHSIGGTIRALIAGVSRHIKTTGPPEHLRPAGNPRTAGVGVIEIPFIGAGLQYCEKTGVVQAVGGAETEVRAQRRLQAGQHAKIVITGIIPVTGTFIPETIVRGEVLHHRSL